MPTYEYACKSCGEHLEVAQSFKDAPLTTCPACGGPLRKVFGTIGISFKGSGFYKNDSRPAPKADKSEKSESSSDKSSAGAGEKSSAPSSSSSESGKAAAAS